MLLSRTNVLAAYIMRYIRAFLPLENYSFSPQNVTIAGQFLDRILSTISMPPKEYRRENPSLWRPKTTPWVGTRHRMDALYGRTFGLQKMRSHTLEHIDDFFGPLNVETVSQVLHFAMVNCVTDSRGINRYVTPARVKERLSFPMMSIHGENNGLADPATMAIMKKMLDQAGVCYLNEVCGGPQPENEDLVAKVSSVKEIEQLIDRAGPSLACGRPCYLTWLIKDHGHQDCLIGKDAKSNCRVIAKYLGMPDVHAAPAMIATPTAEDRP